MPALLGLDHPESLLTGPVEVVGGVAGTPDADLDDPVASQEALLDSAAKRRAVGDLGPEHGVVDVGVGVDVDQPDGPVLLRHGTQDGKDHRVVATHRRGHDVMGQEVVEVLLDGVDGSQQVKWAGRHVTRVVDAEAVERGGAGSHVVGT